MSTKPGNLKGNLDALDFTLSAPDMAAIDNLGQNGLRIVDKHVCPSHQIGIEDITNFQSAVALRVALPLAFVVDFCEEN